MSFFKELKRRNVVKVAIAYIVVSWLLLQVSDVLVPALYLPEWVHTVTAYFLIIGFLPALLFAWAFELTPEGLKRDHEVGRSQSIAHKTGRKLDFIIIGVLVVAVGVLLAEKFLTEQSAQPPVVAPQVAVETSGTRKAIAVLPFENLSSNAENEYFAAGVHEDILTYLSRIAELKVNSRTSVQQYADTQLNLKEVAAALGAAYIVEGSVRRAGNRVRVTAQLIDANTDEHLWADNFDRELTDIFEIQTAVAQEIVAALQATLSPQEVKMISGRPTDSIAAYDLFLQARYALKSISTFESGTDEALGQLEKAVRLDPNFSQAWALLAVAHGDRYWVRRDPSPDALEKMKQALDRAFALNPGLPEARIALAAYYYRGFYDYPRALEQLLLALEMLPNDTLVHYNLGLTYRRLGDYDQSIASFLQATEADPANLQAWAEALNTARSTNRVDEAISIAAAVKERFPNVPRMAAERAQVRLKLFGDVEGARHVLATVDDSDQFYFIEAKYSVALWSRDLKSAAELAQRDTFFDPLVKGWGAVEAAIKLELDGQTERAGQLGRAAREVLAEEVTKPYAQNFAWPHMAYARSLSLLGEHEEAIASCARAMQIMPIENDKVHGPEMAKVCAWVHARAGDTEWALDQLEMLMEIGWNINSWFLTLNPEWDFLRGNPRFVALAARPVNQE